MKEELVIAAFIKACQRNTSWELPTNSCFHCYIWFGCSSNIWPRPL